MKKFFCFICFDLPDASHLKSLGGSSAESSVLRGYIETLLELPWDKVSKDNQDLKNAARVLDEDHYGLEKVKERVLEFLMRLHRTF